MSDEGPTAIDAFHRLYYDLAQTGGTWKDTYWFGVGVQKCPLDLWIYQELLFDVRPHLIVETGTCDGGSAYFLASICDLLGQGRVWTIDLDTLRAPSWPKHPRITYVAGSSTDPDVVRRVRNEAAMADCVLVILDSDHSRDHVLAELEAYAPLVTRDSYLIVEDTNVNGHPVSPEFGPGPLEALEKFLPDHPEFEVDSSREKLLLTFNPRGFLRRVR